jgi:hypothetical protein
VQVAADAAAKERTGAVGRLTNSVGAEGRTSCAREEWGDGKEAASDASCYSSSHFQTNAPDSTA